MDKTPKFSTIKLSPDKRYLITDGNEPFFWLADTWWYGMTSRMPLPIFEKLAKQRVEQGFTVIQIVVGIPPETQNYDMPLDETYFKEVEKKLNILWENNLVPCIVGGWGHHIDILGEGRIKTLWEQILMLVKNKPAILCLCGEVDIFPSRVRFFKKLLLKSRLRKWKEVADFIVKNDKNKRLITAHVSGQSTADSILGNPDWMSIDSIQSGHSKDSIPFMVNAILESKKMIINLEPWYEGILGNFDEYYQRIAFWLCVLSGAKGHSYGAHGIWQMADNDGFMAHWGNSNWREAVKFPGAIQLGKSVKFLQNYPWWEITPAFKIINPSWSSSNAFGPVAATVGKERIFVYFPDTSLKAYYSITLPNGREVYDILWIDPRTLTTIKTEKYKGKLLHVEFPKDVNSKDILCILSPVL